MSDIKKQNLFNSSTYQKLLDDTLNDTFDKKIMGIAIERAAGNTEKAQALYILFMINGHWPKYKLLV